jgi:hypothetical protein
MPQLIGNSPSQVPSNSMLGRMAYMNPDQVVVELSGSTAPKKPGDMVFQLTSDTSLAVKVMGSDGVVRSVALTLA